MRGIGINPDGDPSSSLNDDEPRDPRNPGGPGGPRGPRRRRSSDEDSDEESKLFRWSKNRKDRIYSL